MVEHTSPTPPARRSGRPTVGMPHSSGVCSAAGRSTSRPLRALSERSRWASTMSMGGRECRMMNAECRMGNARYQSLRLFLILHSSFCILHSKYVPHHASPEGSEVIAAFEGADESAAAVGLGCAAEEAGHPLEALLAQVHLGERVLAVGVEAG